MSINNSKIENKEENKKYWYPSSPIKNIIFRNNDMKVNLITNLMKIEISEKEQKLWIYSVSIEPELARDNFSLYSKIQRLIDKDLNIYFTKKMFSGYNLFASTNNPPQIIKITTYAEDVEYTVTLKFIGKFEMSSVINFEGENQRKKSIIERIIKSILLSNKNTIKFGNDRTIVKISQKNVYEADSNQNNKGSIYKGFFTSAQITENGLFLLVLNVNKYVNEVTADQKIYELRKKYKKFQESEIRKIVNDYFFHKTVLTIYGSYRTYRVKSVDFDASPVKTSINIRDGDVMKTVSIKDYFKRQYNINIINLEQPLIIVENKRRNINLLKSGNCNDYKNNQEMQIVYLIPELVFLTGNLEGEDTKDRRRNIISKTKLDPNKKMKEINEIKELINNNSSYKLYKGKDGTQHKSKTPSELSKEWGIIFGDNLSIISRVLPQPILLYGRDNEICPKNGIFRSGITRKSVLLNANNFVYIYDRRDNSDIRNCLKLLIEKGRSKGMQIDVNANEAKKVILENYSSWEDIYRYLGIIKAHAKEIKMIIVFLSSNLESYYSDLKSFFTNEVKVATQFVISKKLQDPRRAGSIMFNIVEQINIKIGGTNYYIDFYKEKISSKNKIYLILGLESRQSSQGKDYVMTASTSLYLNKMVTTIKSAKNFTDEKEKAIENLIALSLKELAKSAPHPPDYIILYRQGGNYVQNKQLAEEEVPYFKKYLKNRFKNYNPKFIYICCNLKANLKFFEKKNNGYFNPPSGLCVDSEVTQKDIYEFYIQPQFVNQGTATPTHYQVLYDESEDEAVENRLKMEQLQMLSFHLSFYYWTWSGAVRVPGALKLATTAMNFFTTHLKSKFEHENNQFINPEYI